MILHLIGQIGAAGGTGYAVEYAGSAVRGLGIEGRLTICNLSIELGAKYGLVAPDDITFEYLSGRPMSPRGALWDEAVRAWRTLTSDPGEIFVREVILEFEGIQHDTNWARGHKTE